MDLPGNSLTTRPIWTGWEFIIEQYPSWQFRIIDNPDPRFGNGSVWTRTQTQSDGPELLLTLNPTKVVGHICHPLNALSTLQSSCFVRTVRCGNVIWWSIHGRLPSSKTFTCTWSSSPIATCAKHRNHHLEKGIHHHHCNWETISYPSKGCYWRLRWTRQRDETQDNIGKIVRLKPQRAL